MDLSKIEKKVLYSFLIKHEKELVQELYTLKCKIEKELFDSLTIEEIHDLRNSQTEKLD